MLLKHKQCFCCCTYRHTESRDLDKPKPWASVNKPAALPHRRGPTRAGQKRWLPPLLVWIQQLQDCSQAAKKPLHSPYITPKTNAGKAQLPALALLSQEPLFTPPPHSFHFRGAPSIWEQLTNHSQHSSHASKPSSQLPHHKLLTCNSQHANLYPLPLASSPHIWWAQTRMVLKVILPAANQLRSGFRKSWQPPGVLATTLP